MILSREQLAAAMPALARRPAMLEAYLGPLNEALAEFDVTTDKRVAAFLAQVGHESNDFTRLEENLNYSAQGLRKTFGKYFRTLGEAGEYAHKPEKIANRVYGGRMGNDNPGDGWRFRGRSPMQLTGKDNYVAAGKAIGVDLVTNPALAIQPNVMFRIAGWYWKTNGLNKYADRDQFETLTRRINGGLNGLDDRLERWARAKRALSTAASSGASDAPATPLPGLDDLGASAAGANLPSVAGASGGAPDAGPLVGNAGDAASGALAAPPVVPVPTSATDVAPAETPKQPTIADRLTTSTTFLQSTGIQVTSIVAGVGAFFAWPGAPWVMLALLAFGVVAYVVYQWGESRRKANEASAQTAIRVAEAATAARIEEARRTEPSAEQVAALRARWEAEKIIARGPS